MVDEQTEFPVEETAQMLLREISPGSTVRAIEPLPGSYSNFTYLVYARSADGSDFCMIMRRYKVFGSYDLGEKARREFKTLELLRQNRLPSPQPLLLDEQGVILGSPGIVTNYVAGAQIEEPSAPVSWARALAAMLARSSARKAGSRNRRQARRSGTSLTAPG